MGSSSGVTELLGSVNRPAPRDTTPEDAAQSRRPTPRSQSAPGPILPAPSSAPRDTGRDRGGLADARTIKDTDLPPELRGRLGTIPLGADPSRSENRLPTIPEPTGPQVDPMRTQPDRPVVRPSPAPLSPIPRRRPSADQQRASGARQSVRTQAPTLVDARRKPQPRGQGAKGQPRPGPQVAAAARIDPQAVANKLGWIPAVGDVVEGWIIDSEIGRGGMGRVYHARHQVTGQEVALKMLMPQGQRDRSHRDRFINEAKVLAKLEHPNLVSMLGFFEAKGRLFIIMRFARGQTLDGLLNARGRLPPSEAGAIFGQICDAVSHVHSHKILHRDLKPSNVIINDDGQVMVMDFGIARAVGDTSMTLSGMVVGTAEYVAPEQACGLSRDDLRSDVYALGVLMYEMVTGHVPFSHHSPAEVLRQHVSSHPPPPKVVAPEVPEALNTALLIALSKAPEKRFQTPEAFKQAVSAAVSGTEPAMPEIHLPEPTPTPGGEPLPREAREGHDEFQRPTQSQPMEGKRKIPWIVFAALLAVAGVGFGIWFLLERVLPGFE